MDISDADDELSRLKKIDESTFLKLTSEFSVLAEVTNQETHVETGSLQGSENSSFQTSAGKWEGEWEAGGPSVGFKNDPVKYAQAERDRGGSHDFLRFFLGSDGNFIKHTVERFYRD